MAPLAVNTGRSARPAKSTGALLSWMAYSRLPIFCVPRGQQILGGERIGDVIGRQTAGLHGGRIEVDLDLPELAAERKRDGRARHGDQWRTHRIDGDVEHRLFRLPLPARAIWMIGTVEALMFGSAAA